MNPPPPKRPPRNFRPEPFAYHEEVELRIDTLTNMGQGLGRIDGWVVMVAFALPGERVRARVFHNHKGHSEADLVALLEPSPHRVEPPCPYFGECGGCQYQNLAYAEQLAWKQRQVGELLRHMAKIEHPVEPVIASPREYGYRSKITPHFDKPRGGEIGPIGFLRAGSRGRLVDIERCAIAADEINAALGKVRGSVRARAASYKKGATLLLRRGSDGGVATNPNEPVKERAGGIEFEFLAGAFFQNNPFILDAFAGYVREQAAASGARYLVDAYCGSGLFALACAGAFEQVAGVEVSEAAVDWAKRNAASNAIANCRFVAGKAEAIFAGIEFPGAERGDHRPAAQGLRRSLPPAALRLPPQNGRLCLVQPSTQMRDLTLCRPSATGSTASSHSTSSRRRNTSNA
ncbi:MAG: methyltransferase domain-containing protein [Verrucomicrobiales bacterium]